MAIAKIPAKLLRTFEYLGEQPQRLAPLRTTLQERSDMIQRSSSSLLATSALALSLGLTACDGGSFDIPIPLEAPPLPMDISGQVDNAAQALCGDSTELADGLSMDAFIQELLVEGSSCEDYQGLKDELPATITMTHEESGASTEFDVLEQLNSVDALESIKNMRHAVAIDLKEQMAAQGVSDPALISNVSVDNLKIKWPENGLTINTVPFELYVGAFGLDTEGETEEGLSKIEALIDAGDLVKIGTIAAQPAMSTDELPVEFTDDDAKAVFSDRLKDLSFTFMVTVPEDAAIELTTTEAGDLVKPDGMATLVLAADLIFTAQAQGILDAARAASGADTAEAEGGETVE